MTRETIVFYASFWEVMQKMNQADRLAFVEAICSYAFEGKEMTLSGAAELAFILAKPQLDATIQRFENGKRGGRPKKNDSFEDGFENKKSMVLKNENHSFDFEKPNNNNNNNNNNNISLSGKEREIFQKFFFKNFQNPKEELTRYLEWGNSTGWKKSNGAAITDIVAYASFWKSESENKRFPLLALRLLQAAYAYAHDAADEKAKDVITGIVQAKDNLGKLAFVWPSKDDAAIVIPYIQKANRNTLKIEIENKYRQ